jgi:4-hydroxy-tetrahydrodipicolinate synthase
MKNVIFEGCSTALITPMNNDGSVNYEKLAQLVDSQINDGVDSLVICGTTGESATLSGEEHINVIKEAINAAAKRVPIIAGTGSNDTAFALELSKEAEEAGADALLMVTPYYNKTSQRGLISHYTYVADRVNLPIILYNVPSRTGVDIKPETYFELSKHKNIVAAKEASGNFSNLIKTIELCGDELTIYSGNDDQIVPIMALGGKGVISVLSNVAPKETCAITNACLEGDFKKATALATKYLNLANALFMDVNPIPVKEAMNLMGLNVGPLRLPLVGMEEGKVEALKAELKTVGLL